MGFREQRSAVYAAYASGDRFEALRLADAAHKAYPAAHAETWFWRACLLGVMGRTGEALSALETGLVEGVWWSTRLLEQEGDLAAVRVLAGYARVRGESEARCARAWEQARPTCLVISPATAGWEPRSVLFLHGRGETARSFSEIWQPLVSQGWTLVVPQSSQPHDSASFCWDDRELALREVRQHLDDCRVKRRLPMDGIAMAGASQGAPLAMEIAADAGMPWLCVIPSFPKSFDVDRLAAVPRHTRGAVILGEHDPANSRSTSVISSIQASGVSVTVRTIKGIGHEVSEEMVRQAADALRELAGVSTAGASAAGASAAGESP